MKPTFVVMLILLVGGLVIAPMVVKGPTGDPIMTAEDWVPDPVKDVAEAVKPANQAYRWKDAEGVWQFSDTKPAGVDDQDVQTIAIAQIMTLPKTAFTGNRPAAESSGKDSGSSPTAVLISKYTGSSRAQGDGQMPGTALPPGAEGEGPNVNDALEEIATRFPQFKAMSDAMAQGASQPSGENPENP